MDVARSLGGRCYNVLVPGVLRVILHGIHFLQSCLYVLLFLALEVQEHLFSSSPYLFIVLNMKLLSRFQRGTHVTSSPPTSDSDGEHRPEKLHAGYDDFPIPRLTLASFSMGVLVSMGGFIFGYDTGQLNTKWSYQDVLD